MDIVQVHGALSALSKVFASFKDLPVWLDVMIVIGGFFIIILSMLLKHERKHWKSKEKRENARINMRVKIEKEKTKRFIAISGTLATIHQNENASEIIMSSIESNKQSVSGLKQRKKVKQKIEDSVEGKVDQYLDVILPEKSAPAFHKKSSSSSLPKKKKRSS
ncbi:hypothetical protein [Blautia acetigignens]|uniref:Uncharacterized protein n=1 Tax=Blautia acetigignens TaxID=2981783 RepID=A0ABV1CJG1_9FIRM